MPAPCFRRRLAAAALLLIAAALLSACSSTPPYRYKYVPGRTATLENGLAIAPPQAPFAVQQAIAAGNEIAGLPYRYGGGHGADFDSGYDCSGATSYVLRRAGLLRGSMPSKSFRRYGEAGYGKWISLYARRDHVFLVVAGLRFDTGWNGGGHRGPEWTTRSRPAKGSVVRHPRGW